MTLWTKSKLTTLTAAIAVASVPVVALAALQEGDTLGTGEATIRAALEAQGIEVTAFETEDDEIEVEIVIDGAPYEVALSPETGKIIEIEAEDGDDDGDDHDDDDDDNDD